MTKRPTRLAGWAVRLAVFLVFAGIIAVFQLDRHSRNQVNLLAYVPPGIGGFADANIARPLALVRPDMAVDRASSALRHRPVAAETLSSFAIASVENGDAETAGAALSLAAQRGWRDTYTQVMVIGSALTSERWDVAAQRVDALSRLQREEEAINGSLSLLLPNEGGQREVAKRMIDSQPLMAHVIEFMRSNPQFAPDVAKTFIFAQAEGELDCGQTARVVRALLANDRAGSVGPLWPQRCRTAESETTAFSLGDSDRDPFAWAFPAQAGVSVRSGDAPGAFTVRNRDPLRRQFAARYFTRAPGAYTVELDSSDTLNRLGQVRAGTARVSASVRCVGSEGAAGRVIFNETVDGAMPLTIPEDCAIQHVTLNAGQGRVSDLTFSLK